MNKGKQAMRLHWGLNVLEVWEIGKTFYNDLLLYELHLQFEDFNSVLHNILFMHNI